MTNYRNHQVKFYSIKKSDYENGTSPTCKTCGAPLRHVMQVDGNAYGHDCGSKLLNWTDVTLKSVVRDMNTIGLDRTLAAAEKAQEGRERFLAWQAARTAS